MPITLQDAIARTLASPALADTLFAAEYRVATGHALADDATHIAHQVMNELRQIPAADETDYAPPNAYKKILQRCAHRSQDFDVRRSVQGQCATHRWP